jgi:hypothetical protein
MLKNSLMLKNALGFSSLVDATPLGDARGFEEVIS